MTDSPDKSVFDPAEPRASATPYNAAQWLGVAALVVAALFAAIEAAARFGLIPSHGKDELIVPVAILLISGVSLITNGRPAPRDPAPELAAARRRWTLIIIAICLAVFGTILALELKGI